jgi:inner membrane protein
MSIPSRLQSLLLKSALVAVVMLLLLWPLGLVERLVGERSALRHAAVERVAGNVGHAQKVGAVMLIVPVTRSSIVDGKVYSRTTDYHVLAQTVRIDGNVDSTARHSGIYSVPVFAAKLLIDGTLDGAQLRAFMAPESGVVKRIGQNTLFLALSDNAGIRSIAGMRVDGRMLPVEAMRVGELTGVGVTLPEVAAEPADRIEFQFELQISGTERLQFLPFAASTQVDLRSSWPSPSFSGAFGPSAVPSTADRGFSAQWRVLQVNRDYPQQWADEKVSAKQIAESAFGVDFYQPVDVYQCNYRAIHYAFLIILLSFMVMFLLETMLRLSLHPIHYAMTGAALSIFYLVLLALSEHMPFGRGYGLATTSLALLLSIFYSGVLRSARAGVTAGLVSGGCYGLLYLLILSEEYALLCGALALFAILAAIMISTRKVDWHRVGGAA